RRFYPIVTLFLELYGELLAAFFYDPAIRQNVNEIRLNVIKQALIMRDQNNAVLIGTKFIYAFGNDAQRVDIKPRIRFVQNSELWFKHGHLQYLIAFFLTARKAFV